MQLLPAFAPDGADALRPFAQPTQGRGPGFPFRDKKPHRWRARATGLVLSHRLRARSSGADHQAAMRERAAQVIALTAKLWLA